MTTRTKWAVMSWMLVCIMMVGLIPVIAGDVYAEDLNTDNSREYGIESVQVNDNSADVLLSTKSDALLFAAVYDENGRQKMIASHNISSNQTGATFIFEKAVSEDDIVKVFMVDPKTQEPLCEEYTGALGTITDSWKEIIASIDDGTYKNKYKIGDTKALDLGTEGVVEMQIAAFDADELADDSGTAAITWISKQLLKSDHRMNPVREEDSEDSSKFKLGTGNIGGWENSEMRSWLCSDVEQLIPVTVRDAIKNVKKYSISFDTSGNEIQSITEDSVWIPSSTEVFNMGYEEGPSYTELFSDEYDVLKWKTGLSTDDNESSWWWLRSAGFQSPVAENNSFWYVSADGDYYGGDYVLYPIAEVGVALGFCLGATKQVDSTTDFGSANVGDYVTFGHYEQDNNTTNGKESIEWKVLDKVDDRVLLLSKYGLDCKTYNETFTDVTWETCTLRGWLNSDFLNDAFSTSEQSAIPTVTLSNPDNPNLGTEGGNNTNDQVFLLSLQEMQRYFTLSDRWTDYDGESYDVTGSSSSIGGSKDTITSPTVYAKAQGAVTNSFFKHDTEGKFSCFWWLRSPGGHSMGAAGVDYDGSVYAYGHNVHSSSAVRPALWVDLAS